jgi:FdhD protein
MAASRRPGPTQRVRVCDVRDGKVRTREDRVATEEPLEIRTSWPGRGPERLTVTMRTPGHDFELSAGLLHGEGLLKSASDIHTVAYCSDHTLTPAERLNTVTVDLTDAPARLPGTRYDGPTAGTSACGVCGTQSIQDVLGAMDHACEAFPVAPGPEVGEPPDHADPGGRRHQAVAPAVVSVLPGRMREAQRVFDTTGGLHAAGLFDVAGRTLVVREDIGRHNAVDKVLGHRVLAGLPTDVPLMCVSGRLGFEIAQKAAVAGVGVVAAVGAPSSLALELATRAGLCLVGFVRDERFVIYTHPEHIGV